LDSANPNLDHCRIRKNSFFTFSGQSYYLTFDIFWIFSIHFDIFLWFCRHSNWFVALLLIFRISFRSIDLFFNLAYACFGLYNKDSLNLHIMRKKWTSDLQLSAFSTWNSLNLLSSYNDARTKNATLPMTSTHVNIKLREQILKISSTE
jgi:hypothetical protein